DDTISQIAADGRGWLWFGADCGIFKIRESELTALAEGRAATVQASSCASGDGLRNLRALFGFLPSTLRSRDGRLWMPMRTGLAIIDATVADDHRGPPPVMIRRVAVDGQTSAWYGGELA